MAMDWESVRAQGAVFLVSGMGLVAVAILAFFFSFIVSLGIVGIVFTLFGVASGNRMTDARRAPGDRAP